MFRPIALTWLLSKSIWKIDGFPTKSCPLSDSIWLFWRKSVRRLRRDRKTFAGKVRILFWSMYKSCSSSRPSKVFSWIVSIWLLCKSTDRRFTDEGKSRDGISRMSFLIILTVVKLLPLANAFDWKRVNAAVFIWKFTTFGKVVKSCVMMKGVCENISSTLCTSLLVRPAEWFPPMTKFWFSLSATTMFVIKQTYWLNSV